MRYRFVQLAAIALVAAAAGCVTSAVPAPQSRVKITLARVGEEEVRVSGFGPIAGWAEGRDNTFMHCFELLLDALGRPITYDELMGMSGAAFRIQVHVDTWDASSPDPLVGYDCAAPVMAAVGMSYQVYYVPQQDIEQVQRLRHDIAASLDAGLPVLACNVLPPANWGIICGYRSRGREWYCRGYSDDARDTDQPARAWPDAVVILSAPKPVADLRPAYLDSIKRAAELYDTPLAGGYAMGRAAFEHWCELLSHATERAYLQPNAFTYVTLIDARSAAVRYLRKIAPSLAGHQADLEAAAALYAREAQLLLDAMPSVPFPRQVPLGLPPPETRQRQIAALKEAMELERQAVELLKRVR